jgi:hypothetical protein
MGNRVCTVCGLSVWGCGDVAVKNVGLAFVPQPFVGQQGKAPHSMSGGMFYW